MYTILDLRKTVYLGLPKCIYNQYYGSVFIKSFRLLDIEVEAKFECVPTIETLMSLIKYLKSLHTKGLEQSKDNYNWKYIVFFRYFG